MLEMAEIRTGQDKEKLARGTYKLERAGVRTSQNIERKGVSKRNLLPRGS